MFRHPRSAPRPVALAVWLILETCIAAPAPPPEKLLTDDCLLLVTATNVSAAVEIWNQLPQVRVWNNPAMRPAREHLLSKISEQLIKPLEQELGIRFADFTPLAQGQITFAIMQNGWNGGDGPTPAALLLIDTRDQADKLAALLAQTQKAWMTSGKSVRTENLRGFDFTVLTWSTNDFPKALRKFFPPELEEEELGVEKKPAKPARTDLVVGKAESLLIIGNSIPVVEKVLARLTGTNLPGLDSLPSFQAHQAACFRNAPAYAFLNAKAWLGTLAQAAARKKANPAAPNPYDFIQLDRFFSATGITGIQSAALTAERAGDGMLIKLSMGCPEPERQGLLKVLPGEPRETMLPVFVPDDVATCRRWRLDGGRTWAALEKTLAEISPQWLSSLNFLIDTANEAAKDKEPGFDVRKNLVSNLGDDLIWYRKAVRNGGMQSASAGPGLLLVSSQNPEQLAASLRHILLLVTAQAGNPEQREFLGRKIFSVPLPSISLTGVSGPSPANTSVLSYAATANYVALSTDPATLEEFLRSTEAPPKCLPDRPEFRAAAEKVGGPGTVLLAFTDQAELARARFNSLKTVAKTPDESSVADSALGFFGMVVPPEVRKDWIDSALLPPFERIASEFSFSVWALSATHEEMAFKLFLPDPPAVRAIQPLAPPAPSVN